MAEIDVFLSYAAKDEALARELESHLSGLKRERVLRTWRRGEIPAGDDWQRAIDEQLALARWWRSWEGSRWRWRWRPEPCRGCSGGHGPLMSGCCARRWRQSSRTRSSMANLATVHHALGQPAAARPLIERALAIDEATYGPDHPLVAIRLSNLATVHYDLGQPATARPLLERAIAIAEASLPLDHPQLAFYRRNLAALGPP